MKSTPSLWMWSLLLLAVSCSNPSKTNAIIVATQPSVAHTLQAEPPVVQYDNQIDYTPTLEEHNDELVHLLDQLPSWEVQYCPADSLEGIDFPYLSVSVPEYTEPVLIFPYLDTAFGGYLTKIVLPFALPDWQDGYVIHHARWWTISALWIKDSFAGFVPTLRDGKTFRYPEFVIQEEVTSDD
jgi:hypothetical protein